MKVLAAFVLWLLAMTVLCVAISASDPSQTCWTNSINQSRHCRPILPQE